jgi:hypothetical protein
MDSIARVPEPETQPAAGIRIEFTPPDKVQLFMTSDDKTLNLQLLHTAMGMALQQSAEKKPRLVIPTTMVHRNGK